MSGFLPLEELEPTLTDVLAFIDEFDSCSSPPSIKNSSSESSPSESADKYRKTRKSAASRRSQQKKRAELLALRAQVSALQSHVDNLKTEKRMARDTAGSRLDNAQRRDVMRLWKEKAKLERKLRRQSEAINNQLLSVIILHSKVAQTVRDVLNNVSNFVNIEEILRTPPPTSGLRGHIPNLHDSIYAELSERLGRLYVCVTNTNATPSKEQSTGVHVRHDAATGTPYVELTAVLSTQLNVQEAGKAVWNCKSAHLKSYRQYLTELGMKKEKKITLQDENGSIDLDSLALSRTHAQDDQWMLAFSSHVCDPASKVTMQFREEGFIRVSKAPTSGAIIQSRYRLTPDKGLWPTSSPTFASKSAKATEMFVMQKLANIFWTNMQSSIKTLLNQVSISAPG